MKLATFLDPLGVRKLGVVRGESIVDVEQTTQGLPNDMLAMIHGGAPMLAAARDAACRGAPVPLAQVRLLAPLENPPEFIGVGLNYADHVSEANLPLPGMPTVFNKQTSCIAGHAHDVLRPLASKQLDYEGELGIVIGAGVQRNLSLRAAGAAIFGYTVVNDFSVRDWQSSSPTVTLGKSFDTHGPCGPWIVTADELTDPQALTLTTTVNGEVRQQASTADMIFSCREIVCFLSRFMTLRPGTIITTGTPAGVGLFHPGGFLRAGDRVSVEISGIGRLDNRVVEEQSA